MKTYIKPTTQVLTLSPLTFMLSSTPDTSDWAGPSDTSNPSLYDGAEDNRQLGKERFFDDW